MQEKKLFLDGKFREWHNSNPTFARMYEEKIKIFNEFCSPNKTVLDIGAYDDILWNKISYKEYYMVDLEFENSIDHKNCYYYEMDILEFFNLFENKKFDVVLMDNVAGHLEYPKKTFSELGKHLNDNGVWINSLTNARSPTRLLGVELGMLDYAEQLDTHDYFYDHFQLYSTKDLKMMAGISKTNLVDIRGIMFKPVPLSVMNEYFKDDLEKFIELGYKIGPESCGDVLAVFKKCQ